MAKGPLITRSELRKRQQAQASESLKTAKSRNSLSARRKRLPAFIVKKAKRINQSRKQGSANGKRRPNGTLFDEISYYCYPNVMCGF